MVGPEGVSLLPQAASAMLALMGGFMFVLGSINRRESHLAYFGALSVYGGAQPQTWSVLTGALPADFAAIWQRNHAQYPRGIDLILCAGSQLAALPRSVAVREG